MMSLMLLVVVVPVGIAAIVAAVHASGGSVAARIADERAARERFADDFPDLRVRAVRLAGDGAAAFLQLEDGRVGVVKAFGGKFLTRTIAAADLAGAPRASGLSVSLKLRDHTWRGGSFRFADDDEARAVEAMFSALRRVNRWEER